MKSFVKLLLTAVMLVSLAGFFTGCQSEDEYVWSGPQNYTEDGYWIGEITTIRVASRWSSLFGVQDGTNYTQEILKERIGVILEFIPMGDNPIQQLDLMIAAGDLPPIIGPGNNDQIRNAIDAGLVVNLSDYADRLPALFNNIPNALRYWSEVLEADGVYFAPGNVQNAPIMTGDNDLSYHMRWDLYKAIGMPPIRTFEDVLDVLERMWAIYPVNEDGLRVYPLSPHTRNDGNRFEFATGHIQAMGRRAENFLEINWWDNSYMSIFDDNSQYKRMVRWLFQANQRGLLDPDVLTQTADDFGAKISSGRVLYSHMNWAFGTFNTPERLDAGIGFMPFYAEDQSFSRFTAPNPLGNGRGTFIGAGNSERELDAALRYLNFMYDHETLWEYFHGRQGLVWDINQNGPYVTAWGWQHMTDPESVFPEGGRHADGFWQYASPGYNHNELNPFYGLPYNVGTWPNAPYAIPPRLARVEWEQHFFGSVGRYQGTIDWLKSTGRQIDQNLFIPAPGYATIPENIQLINGRIAEILVPTNWRMVYAANEAEFESMWADLRERAYGMGLQQSLDAQILWFEKALEYGALFSGEPVRQPRR